MNNRDLIRQYTDEQKMRYFKNKIENGKDWSLSQEDKDWYQKNLR